MHETISESSALNRHDRAGPARRPRKGGYEAGRRIKRKEKEAGEGGEGRKRRREGGRPGRRLRRSRSCSALRRRARESALYLTPNQLRSAVPDKILSLFSFHLSLLNGAQPQCIYTHARRQRLIGDGTRGGGVRILSHRSRKYIGSFPNGAPSCPPSLASFPSPLSPLSHEELTPSPFSACMHPGNELSLATL